MPSRSRRSRCPAVRTLRDQSRCTPDSPSCSTRSPFASPESFDVTDHAWPRFGSEVGCPATVTAGSANRFGGQAWQEDKTYCAGVGGRNRLALRISGSRAEQVSRRAPARRRTFIVGGHPTRGVHNGLPKVWAQFFTSRSPVSRANAFQNANVSNRWASSAPAIAGWSAPC